MDKLSAMIDRVNFVESSSNLMLRGEECSAEWLSVSVVSCSPSVVVLVCLIWCNEVLL